MPVVLVISSFSCISFYLLFKDYMEMSFYELCSFAFILIIPVFPSEIWMLSIVFDESLSLYQIVKEYLQ